MRTFPLAPVAALLALPFLACGSSGSPATSTDAGTKKGTPDAKAHADAKTTPDARSAHDAATGAAPCTGVVGTCVPIVAGESQSDIVTAFATAKPHTTLAFAAGTFEFTNTLTLVGTPNLTVKGAGIGKTILDFGSQTAGADGIDASSSNGLVLFGFTVQNSKGNAVKVVNSTGVIFEGIETTWTDGPTTSNGPYGIYPVSVTDLLIENCKVSGASDSGIYVGQSANAVVRSNDVYGNVAGIEIENTWGAVVNNNDSHDNTAGILVFALPNLPQEGTHDVRVYDNQVITNNQKNFGASGDIVSKVPAGLGMLVMAARDVELFGNTVTGSNTAGIAVASYVIAQIPITDPNYYPYPYNVSVHDNTVTGSGTMPDASVQIGLLVQAYQSTFPGGHGPDLFWDGEFDPMFMPDAGTATNPMYICFDHNTASDTFVDFNLPKFVIYSSADGGTKAPPDGGLTNLPSIDSFDITPFTCSGVTAAPIDAGLVFSDAGI